MSLRMEKVILVNGELEVVHFWKYKSRILKYAWVDGWVGNKNSTNGIAGK